MNDNQIECRVERMVDVLDRAYMRNDIDMATYDAEMVCIAKWADRQYAARLDAVATVMAEG